MKIAVTQWGSRIAPLYDTARELLLACIEGGNVGSFVIIRVEQIRPSARAGFLQDLGVEVLLCGGISQHFLLQLNDAGIQVISGLSGDLEEVVQCYTELLPSIIGSSFVDG